LYPRPSIAKLACVNTIVERPERVELGQGRGSLIAPILGAGLPAGAGVVARGNVSVVDADVFQSVIGDWDSLSPSDGEVLAAASHCVVIAGVVVSVSEDGSASVSDDTHKQLAMFFNALTLECPGPVTFVETAIVEEAHPGEPASVYVALRRDFAERIDSVAPFGECSQYELTRETMERVLADAEKLTAGHANLRVAADRLAGMWKRARHEDAIVDLCVGIEALLGTGRDEIVHRISLRSAAMLATAGWGPAATVYSAVKEIYDYRSQVVHGSAGPYKRESLIIDGQMVHASRYATAVLASLLKIFLAEDLRTEDVDDRYVFSAFDAAAPQECPGESAEDGNQPQGDEEL
jgi:Apea-like HEPN